jgi:hypothetical protein
MKLPALPGRAWSSLPLSLLTVLAVQVMMVRGSMDTQQAGGMEALIAREFGGLLVQRQATNLQVGGFCSVLKGA